MLRYMPLPPPKAVVQSLIGPYSTHINHACYSEDIDSSRFVGVLFSVLWVLFAGFQFRKNKKILFRAFRF